jgi:hypothetical protein
MLSLPASGGSYNSNYTRVAAYIRCSFASGLEDTAAQQLANLTYIDFVIGRQTTKLYSVNDEIEPYTPPTITAIENDAGEVVVGG